MMRRSSLRRAMPRWSLALAPLLMALGLVVPAGWNADKLALALAVLALLAAALEVARPHLGAHLLGLIGLGSGAAARNP